MAPRKRAKAVKITPQRHQLTQFGQLDTTPTSRHFQTSNQEKQYPASQVHAGAHSAGNRSTDHGDKSRCQLGEFDNDLDDFDLVELDPSRANTTEPTQGPGFQWSEAGSQSRRSSPLLVDEDADHIWQFDGGDSHDAFSSLQPGNDNLPDTAPIPTGYSLVSEAESQNQNNNTTEMFKSNVDFSETASTVRRSSPTSLNDTLQPIWQFEMDGAANKSVAETGSKDCSMPDIPNSNGNYATCSAVLEAYRNDQLEPSHDDEGASDHNSSSPLLQLQSPLPLSPATVQSALDSNRQHIFPPAPLPAFHSDEEHVASPPEAPDIVMSSPEQQQRKWTNLKKMVDMACRGLSDRPVQLAEDHPDMKTTSSSNVSRKKRQRAKAPIQFDDETQQIKEKSPAKKSKLVPARMPIVTALLASVQPSSSPVHAPRKRTAAKRTTLKRKSDGTVAKKKVPASITKAHKSNNASVKSLAQHMKLEGNILELGPETSNQKPPTTKEASSLMQTETIILSSDHEENGIRYGLSDSSEESLSSPSHDVGSNGHVEGQVNTEISVGAQGNNMQSPKPTHRSNSGKERCSVGVTNDIHRSEIHCENKMEERPEAATHNHIAQAKGKVEHSRDLDSYSKNVVTRSLTELMRHHGVLQREPQKHRDTNSTSINKAPPALQKAAPPSKANQQEFVDRGNKQRNQSSLATRTTQRPSRQRTGRHFSISEKGSPVRAQSDPPAGHHSSDSFQGSELNQGTCNRNIFQDFHKTPGAVVSTRHHSGIGTLLNPKQEAKQPSNTDGMIAEMDRNVPVSRRSGVSSSTARDTLGANEHLHKQLRAAFREQGGFDSHLDSVCTRREGLGTHRNDNSKTRKEAETSATDIEKQMHKVVRVMLNVLEGKEASVHKVAEVYQTKGEECVEKLQRRFDHERDTYGKTVEEHRGLFDARMKSARKMIEVTSQRREDAMVEFEEMVARRRHMYQRATTSLRALHHRILDGDVST